MNSPHEFARLLAAARRVQSGHGSVALATLIRTTGSTYRHAGTSMLVDAAGHVTCPLAGGCPQHDLVQRALDTIANDTPQIVRYNRETGLDVLIETGCGGELEVLVEPLSNAQDLRFIDVLAALRERRGSGVMATVYARDGQPLSPRPQRLIASDGSDWSDIEERSLRARVSAVAHACDRPQRVGIQRLTVRQSAFNVLLEPLHPAHRLVIFGANPGAWTLARLALFLGWDCVVADPAKQPATDRGAAVRFIRCAPDAVRQAIDFDAHTSLVTMTHNFERDACLLASLAGAPLAYVGMIGSRARAARIRARLPATMHVDAPAGLDISAETPAEIALAVASEIVARLNARTAASVARTGRQVCA